MKPVYLDSAATTQVHPAVLKTMLPYFKKSYGNPSEYHTLGLKAKGAIEKSRLEIASFLGCTPDEIVFTSSATESINLAIKGLVESMLNDFKNKKIRPHIITTKVEHKAVLETCKHLEELGWAEVTYLDVDKFGLINLTDLMKAVKKNTVLISVMYVNNEVGTVEPIQKIGKLIKDLNKDRTHKISFHTDATQAIEHFNCRVRFIGVDLLSFTGHKISAPKGIGVLYRKKGLSLIRQTDGGSQENDFRSGTENVPYIVGLGTAIEQIKSKKNDRFLEKTRDYLIKKILKIPEVVLTGHPNQRAPHIASFIVKGVEGESLVLRLSKKGVYISSGSACTSSDLSPSHVLTAMGYKPEDSHGSIRFSINKETTLDEINYVLSILPNIIKDLRKMSPLN